MSTDSLVIDQQLLQAFQDDSAYDYSRELVQTDSSLWNWLTNAISHFLDNLSGNHFFHSYNHVLWMGLAVVFILALAILFYRWQHRSGKYDTALPTDYDIQTDTIYGIDFAQLIAQARSQGNYREAARLTYLQTLRWLSDQKLIDWQLYKTPTQYTYEVTSPPFRQLTQLFLRLRYGGFSATEEQANEMTALQALVKKGGQA